MSARPRGAATTDGESVSPGGGDLAGILLDKDGTLVDFEGTWMPAYRRAADLLAGATARGDAADRLLQAAGLDLGSGRCAPGSPLACGTTADIAQTWSRALDGHDPAHIKALLDATFEEDVRREPVLIDGVREALEELRGRRFDLGLATMDSERGALDTLERLSLEHCFSFVCGCDSGHGHKPGSGMVAAFCAARSLAPHQVAVVGDTEHDCGMGRSAGAGLVVGVLSGAGGDALHDLCDRVLPSVAELPALLAVARPR